MPVLSSLTHNKNLRQPRHTPLRTNVALLLFAFLPLSSFSTALTVPIHNPPNSVQPEPLVITDEIIALDEEIIITFTHPITDPSAYQEQVTCFPSETLRFTWITPQELRIIPQTLWDAETTYSLALPLRSAVSPTNLSQIFHFTTHTYPHVIASTIIDHNDYLKEDDTITFTFDRDISAFEFSATIQPSIDVERVPTDNPNAAQFRIGTIPEHIAGSHNVTIFVRHTSAPAQAFYPITTKTFTTVTSTPDVWPTPIDERLTIAKKSTAPRITDTKYIDVNLAAQVTTLFDHGKYITSFANSSGAAATPTPTGTFTIHNKDPYALSNLLGVYMPYWMAFTANGEYGIHGLVIWPEGHEEMPEGGKESTASIGRAVSPGCVRHDAKNSELIYHWASVGTPVVIY